MRKAKVDFDEDMSFTFEDFGKFDDCHYLFGNMGNSKQKYLKKSSYQGLEYRTFFQ